MIRLCNSDQCYFTTCLQTRYKTLNFLTEYTSNPVISLYLSICSGGSRGGAEGRKVGRASKRKKNRVRSLAKGVDPPLICITEALPSSAVSCRMITVLISADRGKKAGLASRNIVHLQKKKNHPTLCQEKILVMSVTFFLYVKPITSIITIDPT